MSRHRHAPRRGSAEPAGTADPAEPPPEQDGIAMTGTQAAEADPAPRSLLAAAGVAGSVFAALTVLVVAGLTARPDEAALARLRLAGASDAAGLARFVTEAGSGATLCFVLPVLATVVLAWRGGGLRLVLTPAAAIAATSLLVTVLKEVLRRTRPPEESRLVEVHTLSFPSGHAASSAAGLLAFGLLCSGLARTAAGRVAVLVLAAACAAAVGWSRLALAVHWPADVAGGWALGAAVACLSVLVAKGPGPPRRARAGPAGSEV
jgi:membrane-associated phospholipid phosphatase